MKDLLFSDLSSAFTQVFDKLENIERLINGIGNEQQSDQDELMTVQDTAKFLKLQVPTVYGLISKGEIPVMKRSKRCYFSKADLMNYVKEGRKKTISEIRSEASQYLKPRKKG